MAKKLRIKFLDLKNIFLAYFDPKTMNKHHWCLNKPLFQFKTFLNWSKNSQTKRDSLSTSIYFFYASWRSKHLHGNSLIEWNSLILKSIFFIIGIWLTDNFLSSSLLFDEFLSPLSNSDIEKLTKLTFRPKQKY